MSFRDDRDALLARADALEAENQRLRKQLEEATAARPPSARGRPRGKLAVGVTFAAIYAAVVVAHAVTLGFGDVVPVHPAVYVPGLVLFVAVLGAVVNPRSATERYELPTWCWFALAAQAVYGIFMLLLFVGKVAPAAPAMQGLSLFFLAWGNVGAWAPTRISR